MAIFHDAEKLIKLYNIATNLTPGKVNIVDYKCERILMNACGNNPGFIGPILDDS